MALLRELKKIISPSVVLPFLMAPVWSKDLICPHSVPLAELCSCCGIPVVNVIKNVRLNYFLLSPQHSCLQCMRRVCAFPCSLYLCRDCCHSWFFRPRVFCLCQCCVQDMRNARFLTQGSGDFPVVIAVEMLPCSVVEIELVSIKFWVTCCPLHSGKTAGRVMFYEAVIWFNSDLFWS